MAEINEDENMYYITASLVTFLAVLFVVRIFQKLWFVKPQNVEEEEQRNPIKKEEIQDNEKKEDNICDGENDIDDLLIKPEEIEEISVSSAIESGDSHEDGDNEFRCESLQSKLKQARHKKIKEKLEGGMTETQMDAESEARKNQLEAIFKLMEQSKDTFGIENMNEVKDQLKLYAIN